MNDIAQMGHNNPPEIIPVLPPAKSEDDLRETIDAALTAAAGEQEPPPFNVAAHAALEANVAAFCDAAAAWKRIGKVETAAQSERLTDFVTGARGLYKKVDDQRKTDKAPHDKRAKAVQEAFAGMIDKLKRVGDDMKSMQADWLARENARIAKEKAEAEAKARAELEEAQRRAAEAAARDDISGAVDAEKELKQAEKQMKAAAKPVKASAGSASGGGRTMALRKFYECKLTNISHAFMAFRDAPELAECLTRLANQAVRAQDGEKAAPAGFELIVKESAA